VHPDVCVCARARVSVSSLITELERNAAEIATLPRPQSDTRQALLREQRVCASSPAHICGGCHACFVAQCVTNRQDLLLGPPDPEQQRMRVLRKTRRQVGVREHVFAGLTDGDGVH
jgi:hypothetical protein